MFNYITRRPAQGVAQRNEQGRAANGIPPIHEMGAMLRKRREAMGATLAEVETATKIRQKYLAALEADEWQLLPGEVVGRGFLRNYAAYLGLDSNELIERRRAVADPSLANALAGTSAVSALPPPRQVDYRPKDVPLHEEEDGIEQRRELRVGPILATAGVVLLLLFVIWVATLFGGRVINGVGGMIEGVQAWATTTFSRPEPSPTPQLQVAASNQAPTFTPTTMIVATPANSSAESVATATPDTSGLILMPTATPTPLGDAQATANAPAEAPAQPEADNAAAAAAPAPVEPPPITPTPTELPTEAPTEAPTEIPTETPTETPTEVAAAVVPPVCPDSRVVLTSPGSNAVVSGDVGVVGSATHEMFQYYKLEFAPGAGASDGFVYFAGAEAPVQGGLLGTFSSSAVANGAYTIRLIVVDQTGNFPPPCQVTIFVQN